MTSQHQSAPARLNHKAKPQFSFKPEVPKQWRHFSIIALAAFVTVIGIERDTIPNSITASNTTSAAQVAKASDLTRVVLPSIQSISLPPIPTRNEGSSDPAVPAYHVYLLDDESKITLFEKNSDDRIAIASTTKIITAMVAIQNYDLNKTINISQEASSQIGSGVGFRVGEQASVNQLLHGLLMVSGNDAAYALAEQIAEPGDSSPTERFVGKMNELALNLGMQNTHFYDPAGLNDAGYSSASDMAKFMSYALNNQTFAKIVSTADYQYLSPENFLHTFTNSNRLITDEMHYDGIIGGKTGYTPKTPEGGAGHCLIVAAVRNGHRLIAAVYDTYSTAPQASAETARSLFDYGFSNFTWKDITR